VRRSRDAASVVLERNRQADLEFPVVVSRELAPGRRVERSIRKSSAADYGSHDLLSVEPEIQSRAKVLRRNRLIRTDESG
jgi:hypothetical protein